MFTGPVGPVEVFFYWLEVVFGNFYWPGAIGSPLASSPTCIVIFIVNSKQISEIWKPYCSSKYQKLTFHNTIHTFSQNSFLFLSDVKAKRFTRQDGRHKGEEVKCRGQDVEASRYGGRG